MQKLAKALSTFSTIFVQNDDSVRLLKKLGYDNVVVAGDTRFDRVAAIAKNGKHVPIIEQFINNNIEIRNLTNLRDTLLPKLMSGEIDVNEVEI